MSWWLTVTLHCLMTLAIGVYIIFRFHRFTFIKRLAEKNKILSWVVVAVPVLSLGFFAFFNIFAMTIVTLHLAGGVAICDLVACIVRKVSKKDFSYNVQNLVAILLTVGYLGMGWYFAHHIYATEYTFSTEKNIGSDIRIVSFADLHLGITLDGESFAAEMKRVQETDPDVVMIVGDFADDDTKRADMIAACRALGELNTTYGVYFVFGNHEQGYFDYRDFTIEDLHCELTKNGVHVLEDEAVLIDDRFYIVGRCDRSVEGRQDADKLTADLDKSKYIVLLDHQPNDYDNEAAAGADLVISGHTHGGHIFPAGYIGYAIGANDKEYGTEVREGTTFVVTSGISGWAIPFKTGAVSEFVVIDVTPRS